MKSILFTATLCLALIDAFAQSNNKPVNSNYMKEYSFIVRVPVTYSREQVQQANTVWTKLLEQWKASDIFVTSFPFPGEGFVVSGKEKVTKKESVLSDNTRVVSAIFLRAEDFDKALELAKTFPVLEYGGSVEVREVFKPAPTK